MKRFLTAVIYFIMIRALLASVVLIIAIGVFAMAVVGLFAPETAVKWVVRTWQQIKGRMDVALQNGEPS